jgi:hypothetical protein
MISYCISLRSANLRNNGDCAVTLQREYTVLKLLSRRREPDFASNTVAFCEWHTPSSLDPNLPPLLKMARFGVDKQVVVLKSRLSGGRRGHGNLNELEVRISTMSIANTYL